MPNLLTEAALLAIGRTLGFSLLGAVSSPATVTTPDTRVTRVTSTRDVYTLYVTCIITILYIVCNIYNFLWLMFPCFGKLSRVMSAYKYNMLERAHGSGKSDREVLGDLYDIYYNNRDLRLLLDLLATSSGVAPAIAIMTLFDKVSRYLDNLQIWNLQSN